MSVQLNHTIVWCRDKRVSASFLVDLLGLRPPTESGPMLVVALDNGVSLDYYDQDGTISSQHYAFVTSPSEFDTIFARIRERGLPYWAAPGKQRPDEVYQHNGDRGVYIDDPDGHLLEVIGRP